MLKSFLVLPIAIATMFLGPNAKAQVAPIYEPYRYEYETTVPQSAQIPATALQTILESLNQAVEKAASAQSLRCSELSITAIGSEKSDLLLKGGFSCAQVEWNDLNEEKLVRTVKKATGWKFIILPPAGGGGGTIHN